MLTKKQLEDMSNCRYKACNNCTCKDKCKAGCRTELNMEVAKTALAYRETLEKVMYALMAKLWGVS